MSHTPGPWTWDEMEAVRAKNPFGDTDVVCILDSENPDSVYWRSEEEANDNARLIAAAPDLLAACRKVLENLSMTDNSTRILFENAGALGALINAISNAEGERP